MQVSHSLRFVDAGWLVRKSPDMKTTYCRALGNFERSFTHAISWEDSGNEVVTLTFASKTSTLAVDFINSVGPVRYATSISIIGTAGAV